MNGKITILRNENEIDHSLWEKVCKENDIRYNIVDLTKNNWIEIVRECSSNVFVARPPGLSSLFKQLYDERLTILSNQMKLSIYPTLDEVFIYENKRFLSYWLKAKKIAHPKTDVFYYKEEAFNFVNNSLFPLVAKLNIGASGSGVQILHKKEDAFSYIESIFSNKGSKRRWGPNLAKGGILFRGLHYLLHPMDIKKKMKIYETKKQDVQKGFVIFQEFIPHSYEWRCVCIGDSYFAHKKMVVGEKASGAIVKGWDMPPESLLDFVRNIMITNDLKSQAIDIFETKKGEYLVNEMQCYFGQANPHQMIIDGKPGRYRFLENQWVFEEGDFAKNACYELRLQHVLSLINPKG